MSRYVMMFALVILLVPGAVSANPERTFLLPGDAEIEMVWIEPGTFTRGSPEDEPGRYEREGPQHEVTITQGFYLGKYEITQGQWESVMGTRPWEGQADSKYVRVGPNYPAAYISWDDVQEFCDVLNAAEGAEVYRLSTQAEGEYACRAGTTTRWSFGDDESQLSQYAWYSDNACDIGECYAHEVGTKLPNPWGLYDMHGNVWEWCQDWYDPYTSDAKTDPAGPSTGSNRVGRSGHFLFDEAGDVRSAAFAYTAPDYSSRITGSRLLRTGPAPGPTTVSPSSWGEIKTLHQ